MLEASMSKNSDVVSCCDACPMRRQCQRMEDGKVFALPRRFSQRRCACGPVRGYSMRSSCAPFKGCPCAMSGGVKTKTAKASKRPKNTKKPEGFPVLKKLDESGMRYKYKLNKTARARHMAINEGVQNEKKKTGKSTRRAAIAKKGRLNVLRIYRRYGNVSDCKKITRDMRYMDEKYGLGKTDEICGRTPADDKAPSK